MDLALPPDTTPPQIRLAAPRYASDVSRSRRFRVRWRGSDPSGIARYRLEVRRNANVATRWIRLKRATRSHSATFVGRAGVSYLFRLSARDAAGNLSDHAYAITVVPRDDRSPLIDFRDGWRRLRSLGAYGDSLTRASRSAPAALTFRGTRCAIVARRSRRGGRLRVTVAGRTRVVSLLGRPRNRVVVFRSRRLLSTRHVLVLRSLGGSVEVDAIGVDTGPRPPRH